MLIASAILALLASAPYLTEPGESGEADALSNHALTPMAGGKPLGANYIPAIYTPDQPALIVGSYPDIDIFEDDRVGGSQVPDGRKSGEDAALPEPVSVASTQTPELANTIDRNVVAIRRVDPNPQPTVDAATEEAVRPATLRVPQDLTHESAVTDELSVAFAEELSAQPRLGGGEPKRVVQPRYPQKALHRGIEGKVTLEYTVNAKGRVKEVTILNAQPARVFEKAARRALRKWRYDPFVLDGQPVARTTTHTFEFTMDGAEHLARVEPCERLTGSRICRNRTSHVAQTSSVAVYLMDGRTVSEKHLR